MNNKHLYACVSRPAMYGTVPEGFTVESPVVTDFAPYGTISYPAPLTPHQCWNYGLKALFEDYRVGDVVAWCDHNGHEMQSTIFQIDDKWAIWVNEGDDTKLPFWALHPVLPLKPLGILKYILARSEPQVVEFWKLDGPRIDSYPLWFALFPDTLEHSSIAAFRKHYDHMGWGIVNNPERFYLEEQVFVNSLAFDQIRERGQRLDEPTPAIRAFMETHGIAF